MSRFDMTVDIPVQPRCIAPGEVKQYLEDNSMGPPRTGGGPQTGGAPQGMVVTLLGAEEGGVTWSTLAIMDNGKKTRYDIVIWGGTRIGLFYALNFWQVRHQR